MPTEEYLNKKASFILCACICTLLLGCLIVCAGTFIFSHHKDVHIHCVVQTDSLGRVTPEAKAKMDSLMWAFETHEKHIADKYEYIIEQRITLRNGAVAM